VLNHDGMDVSDARAWATTAGTRLVGGLNRVLKPTGMVIVQRSDWVEAMLDRRQRSVAVESERRER
jgi:hypothetical protein